MTGYIEIVNWKTFQHYKHRNPTWIKSYSSLLSCYEYVCLQDDSKLLYHTLLLMAGRFDNKIPLDSDFIQKQGSISARVELQTLVNAGFIKCYNHDSIPIEDCYNLDSKSGVQSRVEKSREEKNILLSPEKSGSSNNHITLNFTLWTWENITEQDRQLWGQAYPAVNLNIELAKAAAWVKANPKKKKSQWGRFLSGWFSRCQDNGGTRGATGATKETGVCQIHHKYASRYELVDGVKVWKCKDCPKPTGAADG